MGHLSLLLDFYHELPPPLYKKPIGVLRRSHNTNSPLCYTDGSGMNGTDPIHRKFDNYQ